MFEQQLEKALFSGSADRSLIDKLLAKDEVMKIKELMKKERLTRSELLELLYMCLSTESKMLNYGEWDRYIMNKFFVWIREYIKVAELLYDYQDSLHKREKSCVTCHKPVLDAEEKKALKNQSDACSCSDPKLPKILTRRTTELLLINERLMEHNAKFLIDVFFMIGRTTLSLGASGFLEILKNKYEITYPQGMPFQTPLDQKSTSPGLFGMGRK